MQVAAEEGRGQHREQNGDVCVAEDEDEACLQLLEQVERDMRERKKRQGSCSDPVWARREVGAVHKSSQDLQERLRTAAVPVGVRTCSAAHETEDSDMEDACMQWLDAYEKRKLCT
jgi:uncharacterized protein YbdZ (MbtH family)